MAALSTDTTLSSIRAYTQDIIFLLENGFQVAEKEISSFGKRCVVWLQDTSKILKSPAALRFTIRGVVAIVNAIELVISVQFSNKIIQVATAIQTAVAAWKVGTTIQYFVQNNCSEDFLWTKICSVVSEVFLFMARVVVTCAWLIEQNIVPLSVFAASVGAIPAIGATLFAMGAQSVINALFLGGISFLFVDRLRAALNGGYVDATEENAKTSYLKKTALHNPEGRITREKEIVFLQERKHIQRWVAWADVVNLIAEAALLIMSFSPLMFNLLGIVACSAGVTSCVWDVEPQIAL